MQSRKHFVHLGYPQNSPKRATALGYDAENDIAPKVLASGKGVIAEQIIAVAKANGIPIREDPILVQALSQVEIDQVIPPELYEIVAEVLAFVYRLRR
jgi:flagellar biosynthesis protein